MKLICENKHCIYWRDHGCAEEKVIIEERGICSSCEEIYFQRYLSEDALIWLREKSVAFSKMRETDVDAWYKELTGAIERMNKEEIRKE